MLCGGWCLVRPSSRELASQPTSKPESLFLSLCLSFCVSFRRSSCLLVSCMYVYLHSECLPLPSHNLLLAHCLLTSWKKHTIESTDVFLPTDRNLNWPHSNSPSPTLLVPAFPQGVSYQFLVFCLLKSSPSCLPRFLRNKTSEHER